MHPSTSKRTTRGTVVLCVVLVLMAFIPRLVYILWDQSYITNGGGETTRVARSLAESGRFAGAFPDVDKPTAHVAPLYPTLLALLYRISGSEYRLPEQVLCALATSASFLLLLILGYRLSLPWVGIAAVMSMALLPVNLWVETSGEWEQPFAVAALQLMLLAALTQLDRQWFSYKSAVCWGIGIGLSGLLSPPVMFTGGLLLTVALGMGRIAKWPFGGYILTFAVTAFILLPWTIRNYVVLGGVVPVRSNMGLELHLGNHPHADGQWSTSKLHPYQNRDARQRIRDVGELQFMREHRDAAIKWIGENPEQFIKLTIYRTVAFWFPPPAFWTGTRAPLMKSLIQCGISFFALVGLVWLFRTKRRQALLILVALVGGSFVYYFTHVAARYHYLVFGITVLLAWVGVSPWMEKIRQKLLVKSCDSGYNRTTARSQ
jgi:hypothetical protein